MKKLIACLFVILITSCSTNDESTLDVYYDILPVESAVVPEEFQLGYVHQITLTYTLPTTCHAFNSIYATGIGTERTIAISAYASSGNGYCEPAEIEKEVTFDFKAEEPGTYIFKFWQGEEDYLIIEVPVID